jgi:four helix bundle protein
MVISSYGAIFDFVDIHCGLNREEESFLKLEDLEIYRLSMKLGEKIWGLVENWDYFSKGTVGKQLVRASDSVSANISEGFGRFHFKETRQFSYFARGSLYETKTWLTKGNQRKLIDDNEFENLLKDIDILGVKLNNYINSINRLSKNNK